VVHPALPSPQHRRRVRPSIPRNRQPSRQARVVLPDGTVQRGVCDGAVDEHGEYCWAYEESRYEWFVPPFPLINPNVHNLTNTPPSQPSSF
jgi:hypothetical protein